MADGMDQRALMDPSVTKAGHKFLQDLLDQRREQALARLELAFAGARGTAKTVEGLDMFNSQMAQAKQRLAKEVAAGQEGAQKPPDVMPPEIRLPAGGGAAAGMLGAAMMPDLTPGGPQPAAGGVAGTPTQPGLDTTTQTMTVPPRQLSGWEMAATIAGAILGKQPLAAIPGITGQIPGYTQTAITQQGPQSDDLIREYAGLKAEALRMEGMGKSPSDTERQALDSLRTQMGPELTMRAEAAGAAEWRRRQEERQTQALSSVLTLGQVLGEDPASQRFITNFSSAIRTGDIEGLDALVAQMPQTIPERRELAAMEASQAQARLARAGAREQELKNQILEPYVERVKAYFRDTQETTWKNLTPVQAIDQMLSGDWYSMYYGPDNRLTAETPMAGGPLGDLFKGMGLPGLGGGGTKADPGPDDRRALLDQSLSTVSGILQRMSVVPGTGQEPSLSLAERGLLDLAAKRMLLVDPERPVLLVEPRYNPDGSKNPRFETATAAGAVYGRAPEVAAISSYTVSGRQVANDLLTAYGYFQTNPNVPVDQTGRPTNEAALQAQTEAAVRLQSYGYVVNRVVDPETNEVTMMVGPDSNSFNSDRLATMLDIVGTPPSAQFPQGRGFVIPKATQLGYNPFDVFDVPGPEPAAPSASYGTPEFRQAPPFLQPWLNRIRPAFEPAPPTAEQRARQAETRRVLEAPGAESNLRAQLQGLAQPPERLTPEMFQHRLGVRATPPGEARYEVPLEPTRETRLQAMGLAPPTPAIVSTTPGEPVPGVRPEARERIQQAIEQKPYQTGQRVAGQVLKEEAEARLPKVPLAYQMERPQREREPLVKHFSSQQAMERWITEGLNKGAIWNPVPFRTESGRWRLEYSRTFPEAAGAERRLFGTKGEADRAAARLGTRAVSVSKDPVTGRWVMEYLLPTARATQPSQPARPPVGPPARLQLPARLPPRGR